MSRGYTWFDFLQENLTEKTTTKNSLRPLNIPNLLRGFGGAKRDRTADLYNAIVALSQLSYSPEFLIKHLSQILFYRKVTSKK